MSGLNIAVVVVSTHGGDQLRLGPPVDKSAPWGEDRANGRLLRHPCTCAVQRRGVQLSVRRASSGVRPRASPPDRLVVDRGRLDSLSALLCGGGGRADCSAAAVT